MLADKFQRFSKIVGQFPVMRRKATLLAMLYAICLGCSSGPPALRPPELDAQEAADKAIELYDGNGDGILSKDELKASPGLLAAMETYDTDGDKSISREEVAQRLQKFVDREAALTGLIATVRMDGKPIVGAKVSLIPEEFLGEGIKPASGTSQKRGACRVAIANEDLPEAQKGMRGIHYGTYRVEITHPDHDIPAKFNTETTLGYDTKPGSSSATFNVSSR